MSRVDPSYPDPTRTVQSDLRDPTQPLEPDASVPELLRRVTEDLSELVSTHLELAKVEIKDEVARTGKGAAMFTGGAIAALMALIMLSSAAAWGLAEIMPEGVAFLIVGLVWAAIAGVLALSGRKKLSEVTPVVEQTKEVVEEDLQWAKSQRS